MKKLFLEIKTRWANSVTIQSPQNFESTACGDGSFRNTAYVWSSDINEGVFKMLKKDREYLYFIVKTIKLPE